MHKRRGMQGNGRPENAESGTEPRGLKTGFKCEDALQKMDKRVDETTPTSSTRRRILHGESYRKA
jgi:hypothetical protein